MSKLLDLDRVIVEDVKETNGTLILGIKMLRKTATCPHCGQVSHQLHQNHRHLVKESTTFTKKDQYLSKSLFFFPQLL